MMHGEEWGSIENLGGFGKSMDGGGIGTFLVVWGVGLSMGGGI